MVRQVVNLSITDFRFGFTWTKIYQENKVNILAVSRRREGLPQYLTAAFCDLLAKCMGITYPYTLSILFIVILQNKIKKAVRTICSPTYIYNIYVVYVTYIKHTHT